jgi:hypothetical protein
MVDVNKLRLAVLTGMEYSKWPVHNVLNRNSLDFFGFILPRTKNKAIVNLACQIAAIEHNHNIQGNKYHLFTLPRTIETKIGSMAINYSEPDFFRELEAFSEGIAIESRSGPVLIGSVEELNDPIIFKVIARHYLEAFRKGIKTYPYIA